QAVSRPAVKFERFDRFAHGGGCYASSNGDKGFGTCDGPYGIRYLQNDVEPSVAFEVDFDFNLRDIGMEILHTLAKAIEDEPMEVHGIDKFGSFGSRQSHYG